MQDQIRHCYNEKCNLCNVPMDFPAGRGKRCNMCGGKTKFLGNASEMDKDARAAAHSNSKHLIVLNGVRPDRALPAAYRDKKADEPLLWGDDAKNTDIHTSCDDIKGCPVAPSGKEVRVPFTMWRKWLFMCMHFSTEWVAYLTGREVDDAYELDELGMYFPNQHVSQATVRAETCQEQENTIGTVHSHVGMSANFSKTDEDHWNHPVEIVVNRRGEYECVTRVKLSCGKYQRVRSRIMVTADDDMAKCCALLKEKLIIHDINTPRSFSSLSRTSTTTDGIRVTDMRGWSREERCIHGINIDDECDKCDAITFTTENHSRREGPALRLKTKEDVIREYGEKPSEKLVNSAMKVLERAMAHEELEGHATN